MNRITKLLRSGLCLMLALCLMLGISATVLAADIPTAEEAVESAVNYCTNGQKLVDKIVDMVIDGEYASMFKGSSTSSAIKSVAISKIKEKLDDNENLMKKIGFEPTDANKDLVAEEIYYAACVYYDEMNRSGGTRESANKLSLIELIRFILVETEGHTNTTAKKLAEVYHDLNEIYNADGEAAAIAHAESVLANMEVEPDPTEPKPTEPAPTEPKPTEPAPTEPEPTEPEEPTEPAADVTRLAGSGRCETAIKVADAMKEALGLEAFDCIIVANGDNFADALAGSYLATQKNAPILLYRESALEINLTYILENLSDDGIVYLLGGTAAIPEFAETGLADAGINAKRLSGKTRYDTNLAILEEAGLKSQQEILVCTGSNFADSLSASATGLPILLVNNGSGELTASQLTFLEAQNGCTFTIIGGTSAVSAELEAQFETYGNVTRLAGSTREATSIEVANTYFKAPECVVLAYSRNFPDGLCGGPLAYALGAPLVLTNAGQETVATEYCAEHAISSAYALGGTGVLSDASISTILSLD